MLKGMARQRQEVSILNCSTPLHHQNCNLETKDAPETQRNTNKGANNGDVLKGILHKAYCASILFRQKTRCNLVCVICLQSQCSTTALKWMANEGHLYIITADRRIQKTYNVLLRWKERPWSICGSQCTYGLATKSIFFLKQANQFKSNRFASYDI